MVAQSMLRTYEEKYGFPRKKIGFDDSFDVIKCRRQIELFDYIICTHSFLN